MSVGYVFVKHPVTGEKIAVVPTGKVNDFKAQGNVITPNSNLDTIWFSKEDIITPTEELTPF